ncbi:5-oxoprolinase subunit PxpB [Pedobacter sp. PWIIR3]
MNRVKHYPLGDSAIVIQFDDAIDPKVNEQICSICAWLDEYTFEGFVEYVPAYTTITIYYQPWVVQYAELLDMVQEMLVDITAEPPELAEKRAIEIPVVYGGVYGEDLDFVASNAGLTCEEVVSIHTKGEYLVYMIGFAPGFPYLGGLDLRLGTPRKPTPQAFIPAGSVGIAGTQTGVYPIETPGGWQIIGRSPIDFFDLDNTQPSLLKAGDVVRFKAISEYEYLTWKGEPDGY